MQRIEDNTIIKYVPLCAEQVNAQLFSAFVRTQNVTQCWRKVDGVWVIKDVAFVDDWSNEEYRELICYLKDLLANGGYAVGAFDGGQLKGFASVEPTVFGVSAGYMDLSNIHVSQDMRGRGIGKALFCLAKAGLLSTALRSCTYPRTRRWKARPSTAPWGARRPPNTTKRWQKKNPAIASLSASCPKRSPCKQPHASPPRSQAPHTKTISVLFWGVDHGWTADDGKSVQRGR